MTAHVVMGAYVVAALCLMACRTDRSILRSNAAESTSYDPPVMELRSSFIGQTFGTSDKSVQWSVLAMHVDPDGTLFTNSYFEAGGRQARVYRNADAIGRMTGLDPPKYFGGAAVTATAQYVFIAIEMGEPDAKEHAWGVRRYFRDGQPAPFGAVAMASEAVVSLGDRGAATALAASEQELFVAVADGTIEVWDPTSLSLKRSWAFDRPAAIAVGAQSDLWILQTAPDGERGGVILHTTQDGALLAGRVDAEQPTAIALDAAGRLLVADDGPRQQVLRFSLDTDPPSLERTFGDPGGLLGSNAGHVAPRRLLGLRAVGSDASGAVYVGLTAAPLTGATAGQVVAFSPEGDELWRLQSLEHSAAAAIAAATDGRDLYSPFAHFRMDYGRPPGSDGTWVGWTLDDRRYPQDPRLHLQYLGSPYLAERDGHRFLYLMHGQGWFPEMLSIYRFVDGDEVIRPTALFGSSRQHAGLPPSSWPAEKPATEAWLWSDLDGDAISEENEFIDDPSPYSPGWYVDSRATIWRAFEDQGIAAYALESIDRSGSPVYRPATARRFAMPALFRALRRIVYLPERDTMILSGYTGEPTDSRGTQLAGNQLACFEPWSAGAQLRWVVALDPESDTALAAAGERVFVANMAGQVAMRDLRTGETSVTFKDERITRSLHELDSPYGIAAYQRQNLEYVVTAQDRNYGGIVVYRTP